MFQRCNVDASFNEANQDKCAKLDVEAELKFGGKSLQDFRHQLREADEIIQKEKNALNSN